MGDELEKLRQENSLLRQQNASCAALRLAFNKAASAYQAGLTGQQNDARKVASGWNNEPAAVWASLYDAIISTTAGLAILAELEKLKAKGDV